MLVCASGADADATETACSLQFAARVRSVELGPARRRTDGGAGAVARDAEARVAEATATARRAEEERAADRAAMEGLRAEAQVRGAASRRAPVGRSEIRCACPRAKLFFSLPVGRAARAWSHDACTRKHYES